MYVARVERTTLVLGGIQSPTRARSGPARRRPAATPSRRGRLVLLRPDDLWIDWWIPHDDPRWRRDVRASSRMVGRGGPSR